MEHLLDVEADVDGVEEDDGPHEPAVLGRGGGVLLCRSGQRAGRVSEWGVLAGAG